MPWQVREAKRNFSQLVQCALDEGPQVVTRRGEEVIVVLAAHEFRRLTGSKPDLKEFVLSGPDLSELDLERPTGLPRNVEL